MFGTAGKGAGEPEGERRDYKHGWRGFLIWHTFRKRFNQIEKPGLKCEYESTNELVLPCQST